MGPEYISISTTKMYLSHLAWTYLTLPPFTLPNLTLHTWHYLTLNLSYLTLTQVYQVTFRHLITDLTSPHLISHVPLNCINCHNTHIISHVTSPHLMSNVPYPHLIYHVPSPSISLHLTSPYVLCPLPSPYISCPLTLYLTSPQLPLDLMSSPLTLYLMSPPLSLYLMSPPLTPSLWCHLTSLNASWSHLPLTSVLSPRPVVPGAGWRAPAADSLPDGLPAVVSAGARGLAHGVRQSARRRPHLWVLWVQLGIHAEPPPPLPRPPRRQEALQVQRLRLLHLLQVSTPFAHGQGHRWKL